MCALDSGYDETPHSPGGPDTWPDGKKIFVSFVLNYEGGGETTVWNGDKHSEPALNETAYFRQIIEGKRDPVVESQFEYSIRAGFPRLLKLFDKYKMCFTVWAVGRSLEVTQPYAKVMIEKGHEIADHGWRWRNHIYFSGPDEEAEDIRKGIRKMHEITGSKDVPAGWFIGSRFLSHKTSRAKIHKEEKTPLLYCSDCYNADLPYWDPSPLTIDGEKDEGMLMIPYTLVNNDHRFLPIGYNGWVTADDSFEQVKAEFDVLYEEGKAGKPKMMTFALHNRLIGKPGRVKALEKFMEYISTKPDVWIATRRDVALYWREKYPYDKVGPGPYAK